jgi:hypothetical protein
MGLLAAAWEKIIDITATIIVALGFFTGVPEIIDESPGTFMSQPEPVRPAPAEGSYGTDRPVSFTSSLEALLNMNGDYSCHYKGPKEDGDVTGIIYVSEGRARGSFVAAFFGNKPTVWYFLMQEDHLYLWFVLPSGPYEGKALLNDFGSGTEAGEVRQEIYKNLPDLYGCIPWEFEKRFFELPNEFEYVDASGAQVSL